ncbi:MAG: prolipoprotein diacylglyceryl transferase [Oscillospiraceae bacterium]|nr:prolipoprotein diacylglyceryl transferase [Oscillospiraceae bacterium]
MSYPNVPISFPGLFGDWQFTVGGKLLDIGNGIYWYGVLIAAGLLLGMWFAMRQAPKFGLKSDDVMDMVLWCIPLCVLGSRIYYVLFYLDRFRKADGSLDFPAMIRIWDGGIAIYGTVIVAFIVVLVFCRAKKITPWAMSDCCVMGLLIGQAIGRWGNFMNREAFGAATDVFCRMRLHVSEHYYLDVHPTFLYESLWNLLGLAILYFVLSKRRRFVGENTCFYFAWYGLGRFFIEGLRTDSLYLFDLTLFGERVRVSQALSAALVLVSLAVWLVNLKKSKKPAAEETQETEE